MDINLAEKLKALRKEKNISQEKLAQYLQVSFQAVSKWENGQTYPDLSLIPDIARFFGITIDELLQAEQIDEEKLCRKYEEEAADLACAGRYRDTIPIWQEAYRRMPNNLRVKEMLMSAYFDTDKLKYEKEIVELGTELYNSELAGPYYKGQAIEEIARTYAAAGNRKMAEKWAGKAHHLIHSMEMLWIQITEDGKEMLSQFSFANYWYFHQLIYMAMRLAGCGTVPGGTAFTQSVCKSVASVCETVYPEGDMPYEDLRNLCSLYRGIAEDETSLEKDEGIIAEYLKKALACAEKAAGVKEHELNHPLVTSWKVYDAPADHNQVIRMLKDQLDWECFDAYRQKDWFMDIVKRAEELS